MPAGTTALTVSAAPSTPAGPAGNDQASDVTPGNHFANDGATFLTARNTTAGALDLIFEADVFGVERTVLTVSIPGNGTNGGVRTLGPFPRGKFNEHPVTAIARNGDVMVRQGSGADGQLLLHPFRMNRALLND